MKGLILKDFLNLRKYSRTVLLVIGFYLLFSLMMDSISFLTGMIVLLMTMTAVTSFSYDDMAKWNVYALTLPVSRRDMVLSKYILALLLALGGSLISLLFGVGFAFYRHQQLDEQFIIIAVVFGVALVFISILFPLIYRYGVEKSRMFMMIIFAAPTAAFVILSNTGFVMSAGEITRWEQIIHSLLWLVPVAVAALFWISYLISYRIYMKKDI